MPRPIQDLLLKGQTVLIQGSKSSYQVTNALQQYVFKGHARGTPTSFVSSQCIDWYNSLSVAELAAVWLLNLTTPPHHGNAMPTGYEWINNSPYIWSLHETVDNGTDKCGVRTDGLGYLVYTKGQELSVISENCCKIDLKGLSDVWQSDVDDPAFHGGGIKLYN